MLRVAKITSSHYNQSKELELLVATGKGPNLIGCDWLHELRLHWMIIHSVQTESKLQSLFQKHSVVFSEEAGKLEGIEAKIVIAQAIPPKFCRVRTVPHALKPKVELELKRLHTAAWHHRSY